MSDVRDNDEIEADTRQRDVAAEFEGRETQLREDDIETETSSRNAPHLRSRREASDSAPSNGALVPGVCLRNRYVLESPIGQGAMGQVWRARDLLGEKAKHRKPYVAIKVLLTEIERYPHLYEALHREVSRTQRLAHPNIVTMFAFEEDEDSGKPFIVMELLEGRGLDRLIRDAREQDAPIANPWHLVQGIAEGLAYAHRRGIVHSDLKPGNVFVTSEGEPKILDFGIARAAHQSSGSAAIFEQPGDSVISGYTEKYAAPQALENAPPHTADDVFALGLVTYELLTGRHALGRKTSVQARDAKYELVPIKGLTRRQWRTLERSLAFRREDRWQDARQFLNELQKRRHLQIAVAISAVALVATASGLSYINYLDKLPAIPFEALTQQQQQAVQQALADGNEALRYVRDAQLIEASADAADRFADAYAIHPRNPAAVAGLEEAADQFLAWWSDQMDRERALVELRKFQAKSEYYNGYAPLRRAIKERENR